MNDFAKYVKLKDAAEKYGIPLSWFYERSRKDQLPGQIRCGRHIRLNLDEFERGAKEGIVS